MPVLTVGVSSDASTIQLFGAGGFGALIGWYVYYINRYRKGDVQIGDLVTVIGTIGGGAVLALFEKKTDLFGAYGIGLFTGFFGYFVVLVILVAMSRAATANNFDWDWFLDGRRKTPQAPWGYPGDGAGRPMTPMSGGAGGADQNAPVVH